MEIEELKELLEDETKLLDRINFLESERTKAYQNRDKIKGKFKRFQELQTQPDKNLELQILQSANKHKAYNPNQIHSLLKDRFEIENNEYIYMDKDGNRTKLDDYVRDFLNDPHNENLKLSEIKLGSGHANSMKIGTKLVNYDRNDVKQADELGLTISDYLRIKKLREDKTQHRRKRNYA